MREAMHSAALEGPPPRQPMPATPPRKPEPARMPAALPVPSPRTYHKATEDVPGLTQRSRPSPRPSPAALPHLQHSHHFGWVPPARPPTTDAWNGSGWSDPRPQQTSIGTRAVGLEGHRREIIHLAEARASFAHLRPHQQSPRAKIAADVGQEPRSPPRSPRESFATLPRSPRSPRSPRDTVASTPRLQLISWPGHSCFVRRKPLAARPPPIDSRELRRGDYPLMQRHMLDQHHAGPVPKARASQGFL